MAKLKSIKSFTDVEKVKAFDLLYEQCKLNALDVRRTGTFNTEGFKHIYETSMVLTMGESCFDTLNGFTVVKDG